MHHDQNARIQQLHNLMKRVKNIDTSVDISDTKIRFATLDQNAKKPTKTNLTDAGWDLYASEDVSIPAGTRATIKTGIALQIPNEWVGLIWPRSGLSVKKGADILAGVIDSGYRGEVLVCLHNTNPYSEYAMGQDIKIKKGDRIAQILFQQVPDIQLIEVENLTNSDRGESGFGSSGA
tara:strand:- start:2597 stop:3130 length:534 start_codon:yes stop_codon:yes gene_type:complete